MHYPLRQRCAEPSVVKLAGLEEIRGSLNHNNEHAYPP